MGGDIHLGALLFSGPNDFDTLWACIGLNANVVPDLEKDCGISWVSRLTQDTSSVAAAIKGLAFPAGSTLTSLALSTAESELSNGRAEAQGVVIVITDGKPLSERRTGLAAASIRKKSRLMWVPVGRLVPKKLMRQWASRPPAENVVEADSFAQLDTPAKVNEIITNMCPTVLTG